MGLLNDFLSSVDNIKRKSIRSLLDAIENPQDFAAMTAARINEDRYGGAEQYKSVKDKAMKRPYDPAMYQQAMDTMQKQLVNDGLGAITVWHGSPHKFNKFDMSKIGTGEGAQAYGHGLYMAENKNVADQYLNAGLTQNNVVLGGRALRDAKRNMEWIDSISKGEINRPLSRQGNPVSDQWVEQMRQEFKQDLDNAQAYLDKQSYKPSLYKVDIPDEAVSRFLDWDKPLNEEMRQPLSKALMDKFGSGVSMGTGEQAYKQVLDEFKFSGHPDPKNAAIQWMNQNGVPGIRYLDGGSRSAGQGSSNFVLFDDQMPRILEINGVPTGNKPWSPGEWKGLLDDTPKRPLTEFEQRHLTAQKNAALPVEQGGLGLPADNTAMDRAKAMGFDTPTYHATTGDFHEFDAAKRGSKSDSGWYGDADYSAPNPEYAARFIERPVDGFVSGVHYQEGGNIMPLLARAENKYDWRANEPLGMGLFQNDRGASVAKRRELQSQGFDSVAVNNSKIHLAENQELNADQWAALTSASPMLKAIGKSNVEDLIRAKNYDFRDFLRSYGADAAYAMPLKNEMVELATFNPNQLRSRFAAFDPMRRHEADLLGYADPSLLSIIAGGGLLGLGGYSLVDK